MRGEGRSGDPGEEAALIYHVAHPDVRVSSESDGQEYKGHSRYQTLIHRLNTPVRLVQGPGAQISHWEVRIRLTRQDLCTGAISSAGSDKLLRNCSPRVVR